MKYQIELNVNDHGKNEEKKSQENLEGQLIRKARNEMGMTQIKLAKKVGLSQTMIALYERGERSLPEYHLHKIANALNIPEEYLRLKMDASDIEIAIKNIESYYEKLNQKKLCENQDDQENIIFFNELKELFHDLNEVVEKSEEKSKITGEKSYYYKEYTQILHILEFLNQEGLSKCIDFLEVISKVDEYKNETN